MPEGWEVEGLNGMGSLYEGLDEASLFALEVDGRWKSSNGGAMVATKTRQTDLISSSTRSASGKRLIK